MPLVPGVNAWLDKSSRTKSALSIPCYTSCAQKTHWIKVIVPDTRLCEKLLSTLRRMIGARNFAVSSPMTR